mmetsp:Transcript_4262/g.12067  ORF Transcript_4262/g.12067 Transcript_4262/m.12067 type:complete len:106 (-) Transcript_4262:93-410(-)
MSRLKRCTQSFVMQSLSPRLEGTTTSDGQLLRDIRDEARSSPRTTRADTSVQQRHPRVPFCFRQSVLSIPCPEPALEFQDSDRRVQLGGPRASWDVAVDEINDAS